MKGPSDSLQVPNLPAAGPPFSFITTEKQWNQEPNSSPGCHQATSHFSSQPESSTIGKRQSYLHSLPLWLSPVCSCWPPLWLPSLCNLLPGLRPSLLLWAAKASWRFYPQPFFLLCISTIPYLRACSTYRLKTYILNCRFGMSIQRFRLKVIIALHSEAYKMGFPYSWGSFLNNCIQESPNQATLPSLISHNTLPSRGYKLVRTMGQIWSIYDPTQNLKSHVYLLHLKYKLSVYRDHVIYDSSFLITAGPSTGLHTYGRHQKTFVQLSIISIYNPGVTRFRRNHDNEKMLW